MERSVRLPAGRRRVEQDIEEELRFHLETRVAALVAAGEEEAEARRIARREFGDLEGAKSELRVIDRRRLRKERWGMGRESMWQDLRHALRGMVRRPGFTLAVVSTLALGVGANTTMFGVVDRLMLRAPPHVEGADRLGRIYLKQTFSWAGQVLQTSATYPDYANLRDNAKSFSGVAAFWRAATSLGRGTAASQVNEGLVTAGFFPLLGVQPALGRFFTEEEDRPPTGDAVVVLGHGFWERRFGGDRSALGQTIALGNRSYRVIGVAPRGFTGVDLNPVDVWIPLSAAAAEFVGEQWNSARNWRWIGIVARLRPGVTAEQAGSEATALYRAANEEFREDSTAQVMVGSILAAKAPSVGADRGRAGALKLSARIALWLGGVSVMVLLIACANVANLLLARAMRRRREVGIRLALGISRGRLAAQMLTEAMVLAVAGTAAGLVLAQWGGDLVRRMLFPDLDWGGGVLEVRLLVYGVGLTLLVGLVLGLAPLALAFRNDFGATLRAGVREGTYRRSRLRGALVALQTTLSVVLLVGAGLFVRSLRNVMGMDLGFDPDRILALSWDESLLSGAAGRDPDILYGSALERVQRLPGVAHASLGVTAPFYSSLSTDLRVPGVDSIPVLTDGGPYVNAVTEDYYATMGTRILQGRGFTSADGAGSPRVAVVSETMAHLVWPGQNALGKCMIVGSDDAPCSEVVGVAEDAARQSLSRDPVMQYYVPLVQKQLTAQGRVLFIRTTSDPAQAIGPIRQAVQSLEPDLPFADIRTLASMVDPHRRPWQLGAAVFGLFGLLALTLAGIGLFSVIAYAVAQRTQEMGVRIALGARARDVLRLVLGSAVGIVAAGCGLGLLVALLAGDAVQPLLFEVSAHDPVVLAGVAASLLLVALAAGAWPALRAARVDPVTAMKVE